MTRTVVVTGANQGLGMHTVHQIAQRPNIVVFMGSRSLSAANAALATFKETIDASSEVVPVQLDVTDASSIAAASEFVASYLAEHTIPGLDVLINNAAIGSLTATSLPAVFAVNLFGAEATTTALRPLMTPGSTSIIINVSSRMGSMNILSALTVIPMAPAYSASKAALNNLTVAWSRLEGDKGAEGVRVVAVDPGYNATRINGFTGATPPEEGCKIIVKTALELEGRTGVFFNKDGDMPW
ncbi:Short-chain dehydrogenase/reductase family protein [Mycena kentingensis (nom. inval.)]|nr:Short-chain dehydrogenase/reductase family protein [Mycena kentingensis (nom. inval.)]